MRRAAPTWARVDGYGAAAAAVKKVRHEVRVARRHAEPERSPGGPLLDCSSAFSARRAVATAWSAPLVEPCAPPRNIRVIHIVRHAEVVERWEQVLAHAVHEIAAIDEVLLEQRQQVATVAPFGRGSQAEQELRPEAQIAQPPRPPPVSTCAAESRVQKVERRPRPERERESPLLGVVRVAQFVVIRDVESGIERKDDDLCGLRMPVQGCGGMSSLRA